MEQAGLTEHLMQFGLTRQEAVIYLCLYQNGDLTGYEAAKQTGISRSNVYGALTGLVEKGAAYLMEGTSSKYTAVAVKEFCENKIRSLRRIEEELEQNIPDTRAPTDGYITIEGYRHIYDKILHMIEAAQYRIYLSASQQFVEQIGAALEASMQKGRKLVLITDGPSAPVGNGVIAGLTAGGAIAYLTQPKGNQIRLIIDSAYVLTGELTGEESDTCLYCGQTNFVNVFKEALRNEIKLIELTGGEENE